ncbi:glutamate receptor 2.6-like [Camellia sinensis]|uniref:glutamate receptor 2.6-like n=1 Tax=Camellia sinensis TaxID=4442 RepID=UPI0010367236|nr:glutamate receptor 2.6-like [Camellia sinensis]
MEIAAQNFKDPGRDPLQAVYAVEELIKEEEQVIVRMETWHEATLVASIGNREQVPILSLALAATISPPSTALRWPFLVQIATNGSQQVNCFTSILQSYKWKKVIAIYEDDTYGSDSSGLALLSESLLSIGTKIEFSRHSLLFLIHKGLFIKNLRSLLPLAIHLFREAKQLGLVERDSVWIITDAISSLLDSVNISVISNMQGKLVNAVPKGWTMPSEAKKLKIGVLAETAFEMFVKVVEHSNGEKSYLGFCIEVFEKDVEVLGYDLPYKFEPFHLSYDDLVLCVGNKDLGEFESGNITAAFLEPPYEKIFLRENCNKYTVSGPTYKFGGWGFVSIHCNSSSHF